MTRSGTCGTTCILDDVHYSICSLRTRPAQAGWRLERLRCRAIAALYRTRVYQCGAPCTIHERFTQDSPAARNHASEGEQEVGVGRVASFHGFRVVCVQRWAGLPYRCNGSKQIILANENAGLPAPMNVHDYEDSRAKLRDCCHLSRLGARSIPRNYIGLTAGKISWDNYGLKLSFVMENYTETINIQFVRNSWPQGFLLLIFFCDLQ